MTVKPEHKRIVFAFDGMPELAEANWLVEALRGRVAMFKFGLDTLLAYGGRRVIGSLASVGEKVVLDLKLSDTPDSTRNAAYAAAMAGASYITCHSQDERTLAAAVEGANTGSTNCGVLAVPFLTSDESCRKVNRWEREGRANYLKPFVIRIFSVGCAGLVCPAFVSAAFRESYWGLIMSPGVRPDWHKAKDDHAAVLTPAEAVRGAGQIWHGDTGLGFGASYVVIGRPIRRAADPGAAADRINEEIAEALERGWE